LIFKTE